MRSAAAAATLAGLAWLAAPAARADVGTASGGSATTSLRASARLDFVLNIGRFIFFRVGPSPYPATSTTPASVSILMQPSIPSLPTQPATTADNVALPWSGGVPTFAPVSTGVPVEVRTNAGQISIRADVVSALNSGSNNIPLSQVVVSSDDALFPAPALPDTGSGPSVTVGGTAFNNLVTIRSATWSFSYSPATLPPPGTYTGQVSFTAVSP